MRNILALALALALALTGCAQQAPADTPAPPPEAAPEAAESAPEAEESPEAAEPAPESAPTGGEETPPASEWLYVMPSVTEAITLAMGVESSIAYDPGDPDFFWTVLHTIAVQSGMLYPTVTADETGVTAPGPALDKIAGVAFAEYQELPPIPESREDIIAYDEAADAYHFTPAVMGDAYAQMEYGERNGEGKMELTVGLYRSSTVRLGGIVFTLCDNPHGEAADDPMYEFSVESARNEIDLGLSRWQEVNPEEGAELQTGGGTVPVTIEYDDEDGTLELAFDAPSGQLTEKIDYLYDPSFHLADTAVDDSYTELYVTGDMGSSDYVTYVYRIADGELQSATIYGSVDSIDSTGTLLVSTTINALGTYAASARYTMQEDFSFMSSGAYTVAPTPERWEYQALTTKKGGLSITAMDGSDGQTWAGGERFLLVATDLESYATLMAEDGMTYNIDISPSPDGGWLVQGGPEGEWFEELHYAG